MNSRTLKKLSEVSIGSRCTIHSLNAHPETCQRLREIGFNKHTSIRTVVMNSSQLICEIHNTRIGLQRRIANEIVIELADEKLREKVA
jgi:Fe2+ transport system protein FeoA